MSIKAFSVLAGLVGTGVLLAVAVLTDTPWWGAALGLAVIVAVGRSQVRRVVLGGVAFAQIPIHTRAALVRWITLAAVLHAALIVVFLLAPDLWRRLALCLSALAGVEYLGARYGDFMLTRVQAAPRADARVQVREQETPESADLLFARILARAGYPHVRIIEPVELPFGAAFACRNPSAQAAAEQAGTKVVKIDDLGPGCEDAVARAVREETGIPIQRGWVQINEGTFAGEVMVTVTTQDVLALAHPYRLVEAPLPAGSPITIGVQIHGDDVSLNPYQHGLLIGSTGSGKTSLVNVAAGELMRLRGRRWLGGAEKVYDLAGQWLDPHLDTTNDLPWQVVVEGQDDTLSLLAAAMDEARYRQNLPHADRRGLDPLWVVIEELPRFLKDRSRRIWWEGRWYVATELYAHAMRTCGSAGVYLWGLAQEYANAMFGDDAASIKANTGFTILLRSKNGDERSRAFGAGAAKLPNLWHSGEFYIQDGGDPYRAKGFYIQETDARMTRRHDGPTLTEVSLSRSRLVAHLTQGRTAPPNEFLQARPTRMTLAFQDYLRGVGRPVNAAPDRLELEAAREVDTLFAELERGAAPCAPAPAPEAAPAGTVARTDRIVALVAASDEAMTVPRIWAALRAEGDDVTRGTLDNTLSKLAASGRLVRPGEGLYGVSSHVSSHP